MQEPGPLVPLDQRAPNACHVQLKSTAGDDGSRVSLRLSSIERLAKDTRPTAVIIFHLAPNGEGIAGYIIHLLDGPLARVLRSLRLAQAKNKMDVNHRRISFDYRKIGTKFDLSAHGLRDALARVCGNDPADYVVEKQRQLAILGYENGHLEAEAQFWTESHEHLTNVLLGLTSFKPERIRIYDRRFGIRIPYEGRLLDELAELTLNSPLVGACDVSFRGPGVSPAAIFTCEMCIGPPIEVIGGPHLLIRHPDFILTFGADVGRFQTTGNFETSGRSLQRWIDLIRALFNISTSGGTIHIRSQEPPQQAFSIQSPLDGPYAEQLPLLLQFLDGWQQLLSMAGVKSTEDFSFEDICDSSQARFAVGMLLNRESTAYLEFQRLGEVAGDHDIYVLYFNSCKLADAEISYSARVTLTATVGAVRTYRSTAFTLLDARPAVGDLDEYGKEQAAEHGLNIVIHPANVTITAIT